MLLLPFAVAVEGAPPALDAPALWGFAYVTVVATAVAFAAWFAGLRHLGAGTVGLVGLLNPVTGVLLGTAVAGEALTTAQLGGIALVLAGVLAGQVRRSGGTASAAGRPASSCRKPSGIACARASLAADTGPAPEKPAVAISARRA